MLKRLAEVQGRRRLQVAGEVQVRMRGRRPTAAREAHFLYLERAADGANDAEGLAEEAAALHARAVRIHVARVVRPILVETVERPGGEADDASDAGALTRALAAARDGPTGRADAGADRP